MLFSLCSCKKTVVRVVFYERPTVAVTEAPTEPHTTEATDAETETADNVNTGEETVTLA